MTDAEILQMKLNLYDCTLDDKGKEEFLAKIDNFYDIFSLNCRLKVISRYNHGSSKCERQIKTISKIIVKHLLDKGQMGPLFATTAAYAMNMFASEALSGFLPFQLVFLRDPPDLTSLSFPKIDTIPVNYCKYCNLLLARAQMIGRLLLRWRTEQTLEY